MSPSIFDRRGRSASSYLRKLSPCRHYAIACLVIHAVFYMQFWAASGGAETWRQKHAAEDDVPSAHLLRRCTYAGRPFGSEEFLGQIEEKFGRKWRRWSFEQFVQTRQ